MEHSSLHNKIVGVHWESCSHSHSFLSNLPFILQSSNQGAVDIVIITLRWSFSETLTLSQCWTLSQVYRTLATLSASNSGSSSPSVVSCYPWVTWLQLTRTNSIPPPVTVCLLICALFTFTTLSIREIWLVRQSRRGKDKEEDEKEQLVDIADEVGVTHKKTE